MKKVKRKILAITMIFAMVMGMMQGSMITIAEAADVQSDVTYEQIPQESIQNPTESSHANHPEWGDGAATMAFDGNTDSAWHSEYSQTTGPHTIEWGIGQVEKIGKVVYRAKDTGENGRFKDFTVSIKNGDEATWTEVKTESISDVGKGGSYEVIFTPVEATHVKITVNSSYNESATGVLASAAELYTYKAIENTPQPPEVENPISIIPETLTLKEGDAFELKYSLTPEAEAAGWVGSWDHANTDSGVVRFDVNTGKGTAVGVGDVLIQAKATLQTDTGTTSKYVGCKIHVDKVERNSIIVLNGTEYSATGLEDAINQLGLNNGKPQTDIFSIEFKSGILRSEDFSYFSKNKKWFEYKLKTFKIADDVEIYGLPGNEIPGTIFSKTNLETVSLGKNIKGLAKNAFSECKQIRIFEAPGLEYIKENSLKNVKPEVFSFPAMREIYENAFGKSSNSNTKIIDLPSVQTLEHNTFKIFTGLQDLTFGSVPPKIRISSKTEFEFASGVKDNLKIHFSEGAFEAYQNSENYDVTKNTWYGIPLFVAKINGKEVLATKLQDAVVDSNIESDSITSLEFVSGRVTQVDLDYVETLSYLKSFTLNISDTLKLIDRNGQPTTILSPDTIQIKCAPKRSGSSSSDMETLVLGGVTEVYEKGIINPDSYMHSISMPNLVTVGDKAFYGMSFLENVNLESAVTIGKFAFAECRNLESVTMNKVEVLEEGSFQYTDNLTVLTLPETIHDIKNIQFGKVHNGNKSGTRLTILAKIPPKVDSGAFKGVGSNSRKSTVTVPAGTISEYVKQIDSNLAEKKVFGNKDIIWNHLYLRETGSYTIEYIVPQKSWMTQWAYVPAGSSVGDKYAQTLTEKIDGKILTGWNTKANGSGDTFTKDTIPKSDMSVYAQLKDGYVVTFKNGDKTENVEVVKGQAIGDQLPIDPNKEEYKFIGWNTSEDGTGSFVDEKYVPTSNLTVHAIFKLIVNDITLGENHNQKYIYLKKGESVQLNPVDIKTGEAVEVTYELIGGDDYIKISKAGLVQAKKQATTMNAYTKIKVVRADDSGKYTWVNVVVANKPVIDGIDIMISNGSNSEKILNFNDGGYISGNDKNELTFNVTKMNAEWNEQNGLPLVEWYLDGMLVDVKEASYNNPNKPEAGFTAPSPIDIKNLTYGKHTVKAIVKGADGFYKAEATVTFQYTSVYTRYSEKQPEKGSIVWKVMPNATGVVEIPKVINGQEISSMEVVALNGSVVKDGGVQGLVTELVIPETITKISPDFFQNANSLRKLTIKGMKPPTVDGILAFGSGAENIELSIPKDAVNNYMKDTGYLAENHSWHGLALPDIIAPNVTVEQQYNKQENTVTVTMKTSEAVKLLEGWQALDESNTVFTKTFDKNGTYNYVIEDLFGNKTSITVKIDSIQNGDASGDAKPEEKPNKPNKPKPGDTKPEKKPNKPVELDKNKEAAVKSGDTATILPITVSLLVTMLVIGVVLYRKRRQNT